MNAITLSPVSQEKMTLRDAYAAGRKVIVRGNAWTVHLCVVRKNDCYLSRDIKVKSHVGVGGLKGGGWRTISIDRKLDDMVEVAPAPISGGSPEAEGGQHAAPATDAADEGEVVLARGAALFRTTEAKLGRRVANVAAREFWRTLGPAEKAAATAELVAHGREVRADAADWMLEGWFLAYCQVGTHPRIPQTCILTAAEIVEREIDAARGEGRPMSGLAWCTIPERTRWGINMMISNALAATPHRIAPVGPPRLREFAKLCAAGCPVSFPPPGGDFDDDDLPELDDNEGVALEALGDRGGDRLANLTTGEAAMAMDDELLGLIERARGARMTPEQDEAQRRDFAYWNAIGSGCNVTREGIARASEEIRRAQEEMDAMGIGPVSGGGADEPKPRIDVQRRMMTRCQADEKDPCEWADCPQVRDGEPKRSGRHCPLDIPPVSGGAPEPELLPCSFCGGTLPRNAARNSSQNYRAVLTGRLSSGILPT